MRDDLPAGFAAAQIVHAAGESSPGNLPPGTYAIVLSVPDEDSLLSTGRKLVQAGIPHVAINEPDAPYCGALTAIGLAPTHDRSKIKRVLAQLPLYNPEGAAV